MSKKFKNAAKNHLMKASESLNNGLYFLEKWLDSENKDTKSLPKKSRKRRKSKKQD